MFDVYGKKNLFTFHGVKDHANRKKLLAHAYSKSAMLNGKAAELVTEKVAEYLRLIEREPTTASEIFSSIHYFSLDAITAFVYDDCGKTTALRGSQVDRALLNDIVDSRRRRLSWFAIHMPTLTRWLYTRAGMLERVLRPALPMQKPATYTGIRAHALKAWQTFYAYSETEKSASLDTGSVMARLWKHHQSQKEGGLHGLEIASECADHLLAGIDTTSDTLMFLFWALSLPENQQYQKKIIDEVQSVSGLEADASPEICDKLPYLDAVIKETLRLYAPLPASEPRSLPTNCMIDGYLIPAGTVVSMAPFSLHRNAEIFRDPLKFNPDRWLDKTAEAVEMKKWWWAFSSGGRMCIGMHLAMSEMTTLVTAVYRLYDTRIAPGFEGRSPGITSRFEVFHDEAFSSIAEHECWVDFQKRT